ncbi:hypothetical protein BDZ97DRAFT_1754472 [Flammula alnicola]|nr:hypothetical protein BDZ97DRAFT_1754472 [Flammula alnicola]
MVDGAPNLSREKDIPKAVWHGRTFRPPELCPCPSEDIHASDHDSWNDALLMTCALFSYRMFLHVTFLIILCRAQELGACVQRLSQIQICPVDAKLVWTRYKDYAIRQDPPQEANMHQASLKYFEDIDETLKIIKATKSCDLVIAVLTAATIAAYMHENDSAYGVAVSKDKHAQFYKPMRGNDATVIPELMRGWEEDVGFAARSGALWWLRGGFPVAQLHPSSTWEISASESAFAFRSSLLVAEAKGSVKATELYRFCPCQWCPFVPSVYARCVNVKKKASLNVETDSRALTLWRWVAWIVFGTPSYIVLPYQFLTLGDSEMIVACFGF